MLYRMKSNCDFEKNIVCLDSFFQLLSIKMQTKIKLKKNDRDL